MHRNLNLAGFAAESAHKFGRSALTWSLICLMVPLGVGDVYGQNGPPPPPPDQYQNAQPPDQYQGAPQQQAYSALSPDQLDQLVAPIALYPDALVAQVLAASTFPNELEDANQFVQSHPGVPADQMGPMADGMQWDPSIKALVAFPTVLDNLNRNINWTNQLGNAYYNQPQDVMSAVQVMRQRAYDAGNLQSNQQLAVSYQPNNIVIAPASPSVVYVPYYNPWAVYGAPVVAWGGYYPPPPPPGIGFGVGLAIGFGVGIAVASWSHWGWGWNSWGCGWGGHGTVVYNHNVYVSRSVTVVNHGYYGGYDRNVAARTYNSNIARTAPNYRPGYNGNYPHTAAYNNSYNRTATNNFNRSVNNNNVNNFNRSTTNNNFNRPTANSNFNRPTANGTYNRPGSPANNNNYNRPGTANNTYNRPTTPSNNNTFNRPTTNPNGYNRPTTGSNNNYRPSQNGNRPQSPNNNYNRPANTNNRPAPQGHPAPQSRPNGRDSKPNGQQDRPKPQSK